MESTGVNRYVRDAIARTIARTIAEGASNMHCAIIANRLIRGKPYRQPPPA